jgi:hypothetical protein
MNFTKALSEWEKASEVRMTSNELILAAAAFYEAVRNSMSRKERAADMAREYLDIAIEEVDAEEEGV